MGRSRCACMDFPTARTADAISPRVWPSPAGGRRHRPRRGDRPRLGCDGRQRPGRDPGQPIRQSGDVLPIALAARAFGVLDIAAAVEAMVAGLRGHGGPAARRRRDRHTGKLARCARAVPGHDPQHPPAAPYRDLHRRWMSRPKLPSLYLHGRDDGCMTSAFTRWIPDALPDDSDVSVVDSAGHFLQLDQPDRVADLVLNFIGSAR
jgi:pimeloyl-ACP methyl ester carboxylesterase